MDQWLWFIDHYGYIALFLLLALGIIGIPIPDETLMILVGGLTVDGPFNFIGAFVVCLLGSLTGMMISYTVGRSVGKPILNRYGKWVKLTPERVERAEKWFAKYGPVSIIIGYFIPGIRHLTCYLAGVSKMRFSLYALTSVTGAIIWITTFLCIGRFVGFHWEETMKWLKRGLSSPITLVVGCALIVFILIYVRHKNRTKRVV